MTTIIFFLTVIMSVVYGTDVWNFNERNDYQVILERIEILWKDDRILEYFTTRSFKYNRTLVAFNSDFKTNVDIVSWKGHIVIYKFSMNEYKRTAIQTVADFCALLKNNVFEVGTIFKVGGNFTNCPIAKGAYVIRNGALKSKRYPPNFPEGRAKIEGIYFVNGQKAYNLNMYIEIKYPVKLRKQ